jgi:hypothetical protein
VGKSGKRGSLVAGVVKMDLRDTGSAARRTDTQRFNV